jgi:predicted amidohydrolase
MRIALAQNAPIPGEIAINLADHLSLAEEAVTREADLIVFPELSISGYDVREHARHLALTADSAEFSRLIEASRTIDLQIGFLERGLQSRPFNSCAYISMGAVRHIHRKVYLPTYGRFREGHYFTPGDRICAFELTAGEGRLARSSASGKLRIGPVICEELWHPSVAMLLAQDGAEVILVQTAGSVPARSVPARSVPGGSSSDELAESLARWQALAISAAIANRAYVILVNRAGRENEYHYFGSSFVVSPRGKVIAQSRALEEDMLVVALDLEEVIRARADMPLVTDERCDLTIRELERICRSPHPA